MEKDITEKRLEEYDDVFIDIFDNLLFQGNKVLEGEQLTSMPTEAFTRKQDGALRQGNRDIRKADEQNGQYRLICGIENQSERENTMPERVMGYDYAAYEEQIRIIMEENKKNGRPAYAKRIHDEQRLAPVVTAVLHYGTKEAWERPRCLHDMLKFPDGMEEVLKPYVPDYPINLIDVSRLTKEERARLTSDFRLVADYLACKNNPEEMKAFMEDKNREIRHTEEFLDVMSEIASDARYKKIKNQVLSKAEERKEEPTMCNIAEELENRGIEKGRSEGIEIGRSEGIEKGRSEGIEIGRIEGAIETSQECNISREATLVHVVKKFSLDEKTAETYMKKYWKK